MKYKTTTRQKSKKPYNERELQITEKSVPPPLVFFFFLFVLMFKDFLHFRGKNLNIAAANVY